VRRLWGFAVAVPVLLATACSAGTANSSGTADKPPGTGAPVSVPFETVLQTSVPGQAGQQRREAVRDAAAWAALWAELREGSGLPAEPPAVDFDREMVIAAAMETQSCVAKVTIRSITRSGEGLTVDLLEEPPAPNCICITSARPIHIVKLAQEAGPVRFTAEQGVTRCGS
jgi:hypothetical protein